MAGSLKVLHVVAGLVRDAERRLLLQQRTEPPHFAGLWEFPGGKIEVGENPGAALTRELEEELGLFEVQSVPWMRLLHDYSLQKDSRSGQPPNLPKVFLDIRLVKHHRGEPRSREGQHFEWIDVCRLQELDCLDANRPIVEALLRVESIRNRHSNP